MALNIGRSFLGLPFPQYRYIGLAADAVASTPPAQFGLDLYRLSDGYYATGLTSTGSRIGRSLFDCRQALIAGSQAAPALDKNDIVKAMRGTDPSSWSEVVNFMEQEGWCVGGFFATPPMQQLTIRANLASVHPQALFPRRPIEYLEERWDGLTNPKLSEDPDQTYDDLALLKPAEMTRMNAFLDWLADDCLHAGLDPVVVIAAHGATEALSIQHFLARGFLVVSREITVVQKDLMENFPHLEEFVARGQLVLSPAHTPHPDLPYSLSIWVAPYPNQEGWLYGRFPPTGVEDIAANVVRGGKLVIQAGNLQYYWNPATPEQYPYSFLWGKSGLSEANYLFPSTVLQSSNPSVGIFERG